jgi:membrane protein implicated in regulation of membrane protease activity
MNWRSAILMAAAGGLLSIGLFLSTAAADSASPARVTVPPSVRPFDPRTDRLATDSTPELNLAGRPGVLLPNLCEQRARSGIGGQPWTVSCRPPTP